MKIMIESVELLYITPHAEKVIEKAARTCYKSEEYITDNSAEKMVKRLLDSGHHSALEPAYAIFRVICDRGISHEIVRHRIGSYQQESTRYCNYGKDKFGNAVTNICPPGIKILKSEYTFDDDLSKETEDAKWWILGCLWAEKTYFKLLECGKPAEIARSKLGTDTKTEIVITYNFRQWMHFIRLRSAKNAHPQIRPIAKAICTILSHASYTMFYPLIEKMDKIDGSLRPCLIMNTDSSVFTEGVKHV